MASADLHKTRPIGVGEQDRERAALRDRMRGRNAAIPRMGDSHRLITRPRRDWAADGLHRARDGHCEQVRWQNTGHSETTQ